MKSTKLILSRLAQLVIVIALITNNRFDEFAEDYGMSTLV